MVSLNPHDRAAFATSSRLLSCLVTESLLRALYIPLPGHIGACVVLAGPTSSKRTDEIDVYFTDDILAVVPLRHVPVFKHDSMDVRGREIGLLDPLDMVPLVLAVVGGSDAGDVDEEYAAIVSGIGNALSAPGWNVTAPARFIRYRDPLVLWDTYARSIDLEPALRTDIAEELASSVKWQAYSYLHPPQAPLFESPSIDWEQSIVEGHPTHPMHKTRHFLSPIPAIEPGEYNLHSPRIRLATLLRTRLEVTGTFEELTKPVLDACSRNAQRALDIQDGHLIIPVHELQVHHILDKFPEATIYPKEFSMSARAQQSIRSVILPGVLTSTHLKLGVGIKLTSAVRTISPASAYLGPRFSSQVVPALQMDPTILTVAKELASVVHSHPDGEIAKHCAAIVRECYENGSEARGERLIVCTSLVERGHAGVDSDVPSVVRVFELDTEEKKMTWLDSFVRMFFAAFLPSVLHNGVAFEAHPQNTVARFSLDAPHQLLGFVIRDFGGLRVHPPTLLSSTGVTLDVASGHSIIAETLDDVYTRMYHTMIHNHLQQLIRVLGLHYSGKGWAVVRARLRESVPQGHALEKVWLSEEAKTLPGKCFMRMRMVGMYRHHLHAPFPNLLHYTGTAETEDIQALESGHTAR